MKILSQDRASSLGAVRNDKNVSVCQESRYWSSKEHSNFFETFKNKLEEHFFMWRCWCHFQSCIISVNWYLLSTSVVSLLTDNIWEDRNTKLRIAVFHRSLNHQHVIIHYKPYFLLALFAAPNICWRNITEMKYSWDPTG